MENNRYDIANNDDLDEDAVTSASSDADLLWQFNNAKITSMTNWNWNVGNDILKVKLHGVCVCEIYELNGRDERRGRIVVRCIWCCLETLSFMWIVEWIEAICGLHLVAIWKPWVAYGQWGDSKLHMEALGYVCRL